MLIMACPSSLSYGSYYTDPQNRSLQAHVAGMAWLMVGCCSSGGSGGSSRRRRRSGGGGSGSGSGSGSSR